jgi:hypothetical protein
VTVAVTLETRETVLWQLLGPGAAEVVLQASASPLPDVMGATLTDRGFVARTGQEEFLVTVDRPPASGAASCWIYPRSDRVVALRGAGWCQVLARLCPVDFAGFQVGDWLMVAVAGVNAWCLGLSDGVLVGCDPTFGDGFYRMLAEVVNEVNAIRVTGEGVKT